MDREEIADEYKENITNENSAVYEKYETAASVKTNGGEHMHECRPTTHSSNFIFNRYYGPRIMFELNLSDKLQLLQIIRCCCNTL